VRASRAPAHRRDRLFGTLRQKARDEGTAAANRVWAEYPWIGRAREDATLRAELDAILADYSAWHWMNQNPATNLDPPAAKRLGELKMPALVLTGGRDLPYNDDVARALTSGIAGATRVHLPNATHMANMDAPEEVNAAIIALAERAQTWSGNTM
jgi:pimeloyl-ACP methyl ester carboxylesterase